MPLWLSVLILIISIICLLLLRKHFQKNKWLRMVSYALLILISAAMILYIAMTFILVTRDDSGTSPPESESSSEIETPVAEKAEDAAPSPEDACILAARQCVPPPYFI